MAVRSDLIVIGGGPAGATAAIRARALGLDVLVLEAEQFPRPHIGESLVYLWSYFELLGVSAEMDAAFQHKRGSCRIWGRRPTIEWTDFADPPGARRYSLQVERSHFDAILLERAESLGADVRQGYRAETVLWEGARAVGVRYRDRSGCAREARAPWIVDATGRRGLIARTKRLRRTEPFFPDLSIYAYFEGATRFDGEHDGNLLIETVPDGWFWFIPLRDGRVSVGLVCDRTSRDRLRKLGLDAFFMAALDRTTQVRQMLTSAEKVSATQATASSGYHSKRYAGPGWMLAGDAASFVDPMWATGVANAITDGILAAAAAEAVCAGRVSEGEAIRFLHQFHHDRARVTSDLVRFVYRVNELHARHPFWSTRRDGASLDIQGSRETLTRLAQDPSVRYFHDAFRGMGIADELLQPLERQIQRTGARGAVIRAMTTRLDTMVPRLNASLRLEPGVAPDEEMRLRRGVFFRMGEFREFACDPYTVRLFESIDGRRTANEVIGAVAATAPEGQRFGTHCALMATLADARDYGLLDFVGPGTSGGERAFVGD